MLVLKLDNYVLVFHNSKMILPSKKMIICVCIYFYNPSVQKKSKSTGNYLNGYFAKLCRHFLDLGRQQGGEEIKTHKHPPSGRHARRGL